MGPGTNATHGPRAIIAEVDQKMGSSNEIQHRNVTKWAQPREILLQEWQGWNREIVGIFCTGATAAKYHTDLKGARKMLLAVLTIQRWHMLEAMNTLITQI